MTKDKKSAIIETLSSEFKDCNIAICDYKGLNVKQLESFRVAVYSENIKVQVIKNTLASIAFKNVGINDLKLKDTNIFVWGKDQIALAKAITQFATQTDGKFIIKHGFFEGSVVDVKYIDTVSKMPSRDELLGMLLSVWMGPVRYFVTAMDNLRKQKEEN